MANRIDEQCWYQKKPNEDLRGGRLRAWSTDHQEYESGPGPYPVAVVEDDETMCIEVVPANMVCFSHHPSGDEE